MIRHALLIALAAGLSFGLAIAGCGSKKPGEGAAADAGVEEPLAEEGQDVEADTTDVEVPEPPSRSSSDRNPVKFKVSVKKADVLPLSEDGQCWDVCSQESKDMLVDSLTQLGGDSFATTAKGLQTAMGAKGFKDVLPDIYLSIDCGFGQELTTSKASASDRLVARWRGAKETLKLDPEDECAVTVWDSDDDGEDELIGGGIVPLIKDADQGQLIIKGEDYGMGQVVLVEIFLEQKEGASVWGGGATTPTQPTQPTQPAEEPKPKPVDDSKPAPIAKPTKPPAAGSVPYKVVVIKANLKNKKDTGESWDSKIPFIGGGDGKLSDPFVQAYVNGYASENPFIETTAVQDKSYHEWKEAGEVSMKGTDKIHFMVWDKDKIDHDLIGECITEPIEKLKMNQDIVQRNCGQVDFLVYKIFRK